MPLYEYQCQNCHRTLEKRQKFSDPELTVCPFCEGKLERLLSAPAVQFKGSGWYADHYGLKSSAKSGSDSSTTSATPASSSSSDGASSSTPAAVPAAPSAPAASSTSTSTK